MGKPAFDLETAPVSKLIWRFAVPAIISQVITAFYNLADQIFIGRGVADLAIGATNICMPLTSVVTALGALIGMGSAACYSLSMGRKKQEHAGDVIGNGILLLWLAGLVACSVTLLCLRPMLRAFGATDIIMEYAVPYAGIICTGLPFGIFATGMSYIVRADGSPNDSMIILLSGALFNLVADPLLLFGAHMGIAGIALATTLGQVLSTVLALHYLIRRFKGIRLEKRNFSLKRTLFLEITSSGSAVFFTHICFIAVQIIQNNSFKVYGGMSRFGSEIPLAATGAVSKVNILLMSAVIGIALGCQPIIGFNYGRKNYARVKETYRKALKYNFVISLTAFLLLQIFPEQIIRIFGSGDEQFYEFGMMYIRIYLLLLFVGGILPTTTTFFTAIGKAETARRLTLLKQVGLLITLTLLLPRFMGITGVLAAGPVSDGIIVVVAIAFAVREFRKMNQMKEAEETEL